jgi:hypothetical protein
MQESTRYSEKRSGLQSIPIMLWLLIPIAWLAVLTLFVCLCRIAADADVDPSSAAVPYGPIGQRIVLSRFSTTSSSAPSRSRRSHGRSTATFLPRRAGSGRRRGAAHGFR